MHGINGTAYPDRDDRNCHNKTYKWSVEFRSMSLTVGYARWTKKEA